MKGLKLLLLPLLGVMLLATGLVIPAYMTIRYILLISSVIVTLIFYFITLRHLIKDFPLDSSKKIFWTVAIICLPVIGNVIYVIFLETSARKQRPQHGIW